VNQFPDENELLVGLQSWRISCNTRNSFHFWGFHFHFEALQWNQLFPQDA